MHSKMAMAVTSSGVSSKLDNIGGIWVNPWCQNLQICLFSNYYLYLYSVYTE